MDEIYQAQPLPNTHAVLLDNFEYYCDMQSRLTNLVYTCSKCHTEVESFPLTQKILSSLLACRTGLKAKLTALGVEGFDEGELEVAGGEIMPLGDIETEFCRDVLRLATHNAKDRRLLASSVAHVVALVERENVRRAFLYAQM